MQFTSVLLLLTPLLTTLVTAQTTKNPACAPCDLADTLKPCSSHEWVDAIDKCKAATVCGRYLDTDPIFDCEGLPKDTSSKSAASSTKSGATKTASQSVSITTKVNVETATGSPNGTAGNETKTSNGTDGPKETGSGAGGRAAVGAGVVGSVMLGVFGVVALGL